MNLSAVLALLSLGSTRNDSTRLKVERLPKATRPLTGSLDLEPPASLPHICCKFITEANKNVWKFSGLALNFLATNLLAIN